MNLDTRHKILNIGDAATRIRELQQSGQPVVAFVSHLEVLRAAQVRKLEQVAPGAPGKLMVIITEPASPLVTLQARSEVAAGLRVVDYVVPAPDGAAAALAAIDPGSRIDDEEEDRGRTRQLIEHVRSRARN